MDNYPDGVTRKDIDALWEDDDQVIYCSDCEDRTDHTFHDSEQDGYGMWLCEIWVCDVCEHILYKEDFDSNGD